jgi:hypothetical protein
MGGGKHRSHHRSRKHHESYEVGPETIKYIIDNINQLSKPHRVEILRLIVDQRGSGVGINKSRDGIRVSVSMLSNKTLAKIRDHIMLHIEE